MVKIRIPKKLFPVGVALFCGLILFDPIIGSLLRAMNLSLFVVLIILVGLIGVFNIYVFFQEENDIKLIVKDLLGPFVFIYYILSWAIIIFAIFFISWLFSIFRFLISMGFPYKHLSTVPSNFCALSTSELSNFWT